MKKLLLAVLCLAVSIVSFAQNKEVQSQIKEVKFYGIDFSKAQAYGVAESIDQFREVFGKINSLFVSESKKYDVEKYFRKTVTATSIHQLEELNKTVTSDSFFGESSDYSISDTDLAQEIKTLPIKETEGTGLVFVAETLNKKTNQVAYHVVFFDIASRNILDTWKATGKAGGFGLRNYWAGSVLNMMENVKIKK